MGKGEKIMNVGKMRKIKLIKIEECFIINRETRKEDEIYCVTFQFYGTSKEDGYFEVSYDTQNFEEFTVVERDGYKVYFYPETVYSFLHLQECDKESGFGIELDMDELRRIEKLLMKHSQTKDVLLNYLFEK
jgi:hypothetical protein